jgi:hypothetical protein
MKCNAVGVVEAALCWVTMAKGGVAWIEVLSIPLEKKKIKSPRVFSGTMFSQLYFAKCRFRRKATTKSFWGTGLFLYIQTLLNWLQS